MIDIFTTYQYSDWKFLTPACGLFLYPLKTSENHIAQKIEFSIKDFFSKCDQVGHIYWRNSQCKTSFFVQCQWHEME